MVDIERRVFQTLGHDGAGELLPPHYETQTGFALVDQHVRGIEEQQHLANKIETRGVQMLGARLRAIVMASSMYSVA